MPRCVFVVVKCKLVKSSLNLWVDNTLSYRGYHIYKKADCILLDVSFEMLYARPVVEVYNGRKQRRMEKR
jgi:hypothetical protein